MARTRRGIVFRAFQAFFIFKFLSSARAQGYSVFINEIHYDNDGADVNEAVEVIAPATALKDNLVLHLYNGASASRSSYASYPLGTGPFGTSEADTWKAITVNTPGMQNGAPDGLALVLDCSPSGGSMTVLEFLCYEGTFTAASGPAAGLTCRDIGVFQSPTTPIGRSLYLTGSGSTSSEFTWTGPDASSFGTANPGQTLSSLNLNIPTCSTNNPSPSPPTACSGVGVTAVATIQGNGDASPLVGQTVTTLGTIIGDFQGGSGTLGGFFLEDSITGDEESSASKGLFIKDGCTSGVCLERKVGDIVAVTGVVSETNGLTQLTSVSEVVSCGTAVGGYQGTGIAPAVIDLLPPNGDAAARSAFYERHEGMLVKISGTLTVAGVEDLGLRGEVLLSQGGRPFAGTNVAQPGPDALAVEAAWQVLLLDDTSYTWTHPDPIVYPGAGLEANNTLRCGDTVTDAVGVLTYGCRGGHCDWRLIPLTPTSVTFTPSNARQPSPSVHGNFKVGSINVLNFFNGDGLGGGFPTARGADTLEEFSLQTAKIVSAINLMNADVVALMEVENDGFNETSAIRNLTAALNTGAGAQVWSFIEIPRVGQDLISVKLIYQHATTAAIGPVAILNSSVDSTFDSSRNRPTIAQAFRHIPSGKMLVVAGAHLRSKLPDCVSVNDPDVGDGQGHCNLVRTKAAAATVNWLKSDPTNTGLGSRFVVVGDMNAYAMEDPIIAFKNGGLIDLVAKYEGDASKYSYVYRGASGYLDHALVTADLAEDVVDTAVWHINADEPKALDYNVENKSPAQQSSLYDASPYRASDHDPVVVAFNFALPSPSPSPSFPSPPPPKNSCRKNRCL